MRFADLILQEGARPPWMEHLPASDPAIKRLDQTMQEAILKGPVIDASNVVKFLLEKSEAGYRYATSDFPYIAPPWSRFFIEGKHRGSYMGLAVDAFDLEIPKDRKALNLSQQFSRNTEVPEGTRWLMTILSFYGSKTERAIGPLRIWEIAVDGEGNYLGERYGKFTADGIERLADDSGNFPAVPDDPLYSDVYVALQTLSFMHCRNVVTETVAPPEKLSKKHQKKTGRPLVRYKTVRITPLGNETRRRSGVPQGNTIEASLHIVPGHFRKYGEKYGKGKLFGQYEGMFWVPQHTRGNPERGVIHNDYKIEEVPEHEGR